MDYFDVYGCRGAVARAGMEREQVLSPQWEVEMFFAYQRQAEGFFGAIAYRAES